MKKSLTDETKIDIVEVLDEYKPDNSMFSNDEQKIAKLKHIIYNDLSEADRRMILIYAELGNVRATARVLNVSASTMYYKIKEIKRKIVELYETDN